MKKEILVVIMVLLAMLTGCVQTQVGQVEYNLTLEADNFNIVRRVTVINCIDGDVLFQMEGRMSIDADVNDNQLEIIIETDKGTYVKHIIGLSDNVTYVIEDLDMGANDVDNHKYTINYNPKMWLPYEVDTID